jgi:hypothetical protein
MPTSTHRHSQTLLLRMSINKEIPIRLILVMPKGRSASCDIVPSNKALILISASFGICLLTKARFFSFHLL